MHGYMFVGLGREAITFAKTETRHVFVGMGPKQYRYLGLYEAVRVDGLTVAEWDPLPEDVSGTDALVLITLPTLTAVDV